ncbi:hypothetical protein BDZ89DRAFT_1077463 [Hymenopellis radicata]|nr:hypothetical protein BDZ89DRAFT_1077463 [Hymenopellis radicata]
MSSQPSKQSGDDTPLETAVYPDSAPYPALITTFNAVSFCGLFALIGLFVVAKLSRNVRRATVWYTFLVTWMMYCLAFLLIVGHQQGPLPSHNICLVQAALIYASPPLAAFACMGLVIQLYVSVSGLLMSHFTEANALLRMMHWLPFFAYFIVLAEGLLVGSSSPKIVTRDMSGMYCHFSSGTIRVTSATLVIMCSLVVIWIETCIFHSLYQNWSEFRRLTATPRSLVSVTFVLRAAMFCTLPMISLVIGLVLCLYNTGWTVLLSSQVNIVAAAVPLACAIIFGTQEDIVRTLIFWRRWKRPTFSQMAAMADHNRRTSIIEMELAQDKHSTRPYRFSTFSADHLTP